jgi:hypothetical protein
MIGLFKRGVTAQTVKPALNEAEKALAEVRRLWSEGSLKEALYKIDELEQNCPSCTKVAKTYRGKIGVELLEKSGEIFSLKK